MAGAPLRTVQEILGHRTLAMVQRYSHLSRSHLQDAVARIEIGRSAGATQAVAAGD
jgi:site-specific recombinase XerD